MAAQAQLVACYSDLQRQYSAQSQHAQHNTAHADEQEQRSLVGDEGSSVQCCSHKVAAPAKRPTQVEMSRRMQASVGLRIWAMKQRCRFTLYCLAQPTAYLLALEGAARCLGICKVAFLVTEP